MTLLASAVPGGALASPPAGDALLLRAPGGSLRVVDATTGQALRSLPAGVLSADGATLLSARVRAGRTLVRRISVASGRVVAARSIPGAWGFQRAAVDGTRVAGGDHGLAIALVAAGRADGYSGAARSTRIAVLPSTLAGRLRILALDGSFGVDALGPDGHYLYLIQHLGRERYKVRAYDLLADRLDPSAVVDKRQPSEAMQGLPLARTVSTDGAWVLTLYRRPSGVPFVHALMATSLFAFCIDLPASARVDVAKPSSWGVATRGTDLFVANAATGWVGVVTLASFKLLRSASLGPETADSVPTRPLAASSDGSRLYLARPSGVVPIASDTLTAGAPLVAGAFGSLALGAGSLLYATGRVSTATVDTRTGAAGTLVSTPGLTLVGVASA